MHLYLYTHMSIYPHTFRNRLPTAFGKVGGGTEDSDAGLENSDLSQGETAIWGLEQRRNKTEHIVGGENIVHGQEEEWTLRARLSPYFIYHFQFPYQILVVCQQVADLCRVLGQTQEEDSPSLPIWDQILQCGRCTVDSRSL